MSSSTASVQMDEVRRRSQSTLSVSGSAQDVKTDVQTMAGFSLPLSEKYHHLGVEVMLRENAGGNNRQEVKIRFITTHHAALTSNILGLAWFPLIGKINRKNTNGSEKAEG